MNRPGQLFFCSPAVVASFLILIWLPAVALAGEQFDPSLYAGLRWRLIGPFRGGRALAVTGVPGQPNLFYFGAVGGGVWKTADAGRVWTPIFDQQPIASIGAIAVAPSDPNVIYVGSGEADMRDDISYGNGVYKSTDAGRTWAHIGLRDSRQIGRILVDPQNPDVVFVAALGHAYGPSAERGVFRSVDGGKTWRKVLFKDDNTGAIDLAFDSRDPRTLYASLWQTRRPPWEVYPPSNGAGSGLYKSTDGGTNWEHLTLGLPSEVLGRIGIAVAPSDPNRVYLVVDAKEGGLYRSDDAGRNWRRVDAERRIWGRGWYFCGVTVDPRNSDTVYVANTSLYRSRDGGQNFTAIKGAPGGDDYHSLWIDAGDPQRMVLASDQGVIISVDGAQTWSSWYNQPTGQFYHVVTDNRFPYWVYGAQQDSGAAGTPLRSNYRSITFHDWRPIEAGGESGYIAPDPLDPNIFYGVSFGPGVSRYNRTTGQNQDVSPTLVHPDQYRHTWTLPLVFSPLDPHQLYFGTQMLFRTSNGGQSWQTISPDLTREDPGVPPNLDAATAADGPKSKRRGVIYTIAPSRLRAHEIWIGTDDGLIQVTHDDGKTWHNVTPPSLTPWSKIGLIEASRHDANTVYAAVDRHRLEDLQAYIYRTHDAGKTWQRISAGIPEGSYVNAVREDPVKKGLVYAGTETGVFVSFNDGDQWQPLQLNLPNASIRDLVIHDDDLVVATHGRALWVLDDPTPLRQLDGAVAQADAWLFKLATALRIRPGSDEGTPLPPETPAGENPPDGAIIDYYLKSASTGPVVLEILDDAGKVMRRYSSDDQPRKVDPRTLDIPTSWVQTPKPPSTEPGMHRFVWDLRYPDPPAIEPPRSGRPGGGPWALPGQYTVKLRANNHDYTRPLTVKMDPRVKTELPDLAKQLDLARQTTAALEQDVQAHREVGRVRAHLRSLESRPEFQGALATAVKALDHKAEAIMGVRPVNPESFGVGEPSTDRTSLRFLSGALNRLESAIESGDAAPSTYAVAAFRQNRQVLTTTLAAWNKVKREDLLRLNRLLLQFKLPPISLEEANKASTKD